MLTDAMRLDLPRLFCLRVLSSQRDNQLADQAFGSPVEQSLAAQLGLDAGHQASRTKAARGRRSDRRAAVLFPRQNENAVTEFPLDRQLSGEGGECAIFGG